MSVTKIVPGASLGGAMSGRRAVLALMPVRQSGRRPHPARTVTGRVAFTHPSERRPAPTTIGRRWIGVNGAQSTQGRTRPARHDRRADWGDPIRARVDWGFVRFVVLYVASFVAVALLGAAR